MGPMIELFLAMFLSITVGGFACYKILNKLASTDWWLARQQNKNRKLLDKQALYHCKEHNKTFTKKELVRMGDSVYCPSCYSEHILNERIQNGFVSELGEIHKEVFKNYQKLSNKN